jgi:nucleoside-specific outer membrane channel protein Tsx
MEQKQEVICLTNKIINQNYIEHNNQYKQEEGPSMGAPTSALLVEILTQYLEHNHISNTPRKHNISDYYRYVDDLLIIYNEDHTDIDNTLNEFNSIHPKIQYTIEKEINRYNHG